MWTRNEIQTRPSDCKKLRYGWLGYRKALQEPKVVQSRMVNGKTDTVSGQGEPDVEG